MLWGIVTEQVKQGKAMKSCCTMLHTINNKLHHLKFYHPRDYLVKTGTTCPQKTKLFTYGYMSVNFQTDL